MLARHSATKRPDNKPERRELQTTTARRAWPLSGVSTRWLRSRAGAGSDPSFRSRRQRRRMLGQRIEIRDHVGTLAVLRNTGKAHGRARNETLGVGNELVEIVDRPVAT